MTDADNDEWPASTEMPDELEEALRAFLMGEGDDSRIERSRFEAVAGLTQDLLAHRDRGHNEIDTYSGETIRPLAPDPAKIHLEDIAHGLSNIGRFAGQGQEFLSVARHSVHVSYEVEARGGNLEAQRYALVHDAAEAYLSDVPGPVKKSLPGYKHAERRLDEAVATALALEVPESARETVERADKKVGQYELSVEFPEADHKRPALAHDPEKVETESDRKRLFLERTDVLELR